MAGPQKKPRIVLKNQENQQEQQQEDSDGDSEIEYNPTGEEIQATFEGRNLEVDHLEGIQQLLQQLFQSDHQVDITELSEVLIGQTGIGSVLIQGLSDSDEECDDLDSDNCQIFGVTTVLNLTSRKNVPSVKHVAQYLTENTRKYGTKKCVEQLDEILNSMQSIGFLINERFVNIPAKIAAPMLDALQREITKMAKRDSIYKFDKFVILLKIWKAKNDETAEIIYSNAEEKYFSETSDFQVDFPMKSTAIDEDVKLVSFRRIVAFSAEKLPQILHLIVENS